MEFGIKKIVMMVVGVILLIVSITFAGRMYEEVGAGEIVIIQDPVDGQLHVYNQPGLYWQQFGTATHYKKSTQFWFSKAKDQGDPADKSIKVRFNDGGHAQISGSVRVDLPIDEKSMVSLHTKYGSQEAIETQLIRTVIEKAVYMTGPIMSSKESYAEKRNDLISYIDDQASNGVYKTRQKETRGIDPLTNQEKTVMIVEIEKDSTKGNFLRQEVSPIAMYHLALSNLSINSVDYDATVDKQIAAQQNATMQVQTAIAKSKEAEQQALTVEQQGKAEAAKAKWDQEVIKAKAVTEAQQQLEVATLAAKAAEQYKRTQILEGEGDAERKKLSMVANGALEQKLAAWVEVNKAYAGAMEQSTWVPTYVMGGGYGGSAGSNSTGAAELIQLMMANTAKQISLDMNTKK